MPDSVTLKRIIDLVTQADIDSGVYTIIDSVSGAVKKYPLGSLICSIAPIFDATEDYSAGAYCNYNGQLYQFESDHDAGDWTGSDAIAVILSDMLEDLGVLPGEIQEITAELVTKADTNGTYPDMTAGLAEQLLSDVQTTDKNPYLFRRTGADATREFDTLVGGSVVANQLAQDVNPRPEIYGITRTKVSTGFLRVSGTCTNETNFTVSTSFTRMRGHVYYSSLGVVSLPSGARITGIPIDTATECLIKPTTDATGDVGITILTDITIDVTVTPMSIDLTAMFGFSIADYAYTLEQATAGSGIAWLKSYGFFAGYQAYNAGAMVHVSGVSAHVMKDADDNIIGNYPLDDTLTLRGIPKLADGEIYYDGDTYEHDGTVTRYYGIRAYQAGDESLTDAITDGTNTVYKLTTPTTEEATPYQTPQICDPDGTEQYVTDGIPVGHETQYPANLKGEIERVMVQVPKAPSANGTYTLKCIVSGGVASYAWET